jgi:hypothetical protein
MTKNPRNSCLKHGGYFYFGKLVSGSSLFRAVGQIYKIRNVNYTYYS